MPDKPMSLVDRLFRQLFYRGRLRDFDLPEHRVGWKSRRNQEARFETLRGVCDLAGKRVLDLGCGLGCLHAYLAAKGWRGDYTGIDLLGPMVKEARRRFPGVRFERRDVVKDPPRETWDVVLMSGLFNHRVKDNLAQIRELTGAGWKLAGEALAFNVLRRVDSWADPEMYYAKDVDVEAVAEGIAPGRWKTVTGYLPEDITVYLYKISPPRHQDTK